MKNMSKFQRKICISQIIVSIVLVATVFLMPFPMEGGRTFGIQLLYSMIAKNGFEFDYIIFGIYVILSIFHIMRIVLLFRGKSIGFLYNLEKVGFGIGIIASALGAMISKSDFQPDGTLFFLLVFFAVGSIEFLYCRYQETLEDKEEELAEELEQVKEKKQHQRKVNHFPGKYPKEFYKVIWKMFRSRMKVQILMMMSEIVAATYLFIVLAMYSIMKQTYTLETDMTGDGLYGLFFNLGVSLIVLSILMMVLVSSWYMKEVRKDYRLLVVLGIRRRTAYVQFLLEYWVGVCVSAVIGLGIGSVGAVVLRSQLQKGMTEGMVLPDVLSPGFLEIGLVAYLILMLLALALNQENFLMLGQSVDRNEDTQRENCLERGIILWIIGGICFFLAAVAWYSRREWAEAIYIHIFTVLAVLLLLSGGMALWLKKRKKKTVYYSRLEKAVMFYHRFWNNVEQLFLVAVIQILSLSVFALSFVGAWMPQNIEKMYPYDIVVTAFETELPRLTEIAKQYHANVQQYPMVRMTSIYGSEKLSSWNGRRPIQWPQGQQIAISESTYQQMREFMGKEPKNLHLKGEEMHVVYQQDLSTRAHTIEYDTARTEKHLRFGQPLEYYDTADFRKVFPNRNIVSEERDSLTGIFHQGRQDNLIVLSDTYFQENYDQITMQNRENWETRQNTTRTEWKAYTIKERMNLTEGPTTLFCMNVRKDQVGQVAVQLQYLKEEHAFDAIWDRNIQPFYLRPEMIINTKSEIFFTKVANGFILLILLILGLFQYFTKIKSEEDNWKWENTFLKRLGMHKKERKEKLCSHLRFFCLMPIAIGVVVGGVFGWLTGTARLYTETEMIAYMVRMAVVYGIWFAVWMTAYKILIWILWRQMEK